MTPAPDERAIAQNALLERLALAACAVLILAGMRAAAPILNPILLALLLTLVFRPFVRSMERKGLPVWGANAVVLAIVPLVLTGVGFLVAGSVRQLNNKLPIYQERLSKLISAADAWLQTRGVDASGQLAEAVNLERMASLATGILGGFLNSLGAFALVIFFFLFLMIEADEFPRKLRAVFRGSSESLAGMRDFGQRMVRYASTKAWLGLAAAALNTILLLALGVDFPFLWGVLSFLLSFVPNLGFLLSLVPPALLGLVESGWGTALAVLIGYQLINFTIDSVIGPRYLGDDLDLSPAVTIIAVFFWGWLMGAAGTLLALPLTLAIKILVLERYPESRGIAALLGGGAAGRLRTAAASASPESHSEPKSGG